jgi:hypothetical protein
MVIIVAGVQYQYHRSTWKGQLGGKIAFMH